MTNVWQCGGAEAVGAIPADAQQTDQLTVQIDPLAAGITSWRVFGERTSLRHAFAAQVDDSPASPEDNYVRGADLVVTYPPTRPGDLRWQVYWTDASRPELQACGVRWLLSVHTHRLDARPSVVVTSRFARGTDDTSSWCVDRGAAGWEPVSSAPQACPPLGAGTNESCWPLWLWRPCDEAFSWVHVAYPSDLRTYRAIYAPTHAELELHLLNEPLEKGVIRRVQAALWRVPRNGDEVGARSLYRQFVESTPPLTT